MEEHDRKLHEFWSCRNPLHICACLRISVRSSSNHRASLMFVRRVAFDIQQAEVPMWALSSEDCQTYFHAAAQKTHRNVSLGQSYSSAGMAHASNCGTSLGPALACVRYQEMCQGFPSRNRPWCFAACCLASAHAI